MFCGLLCGGDVVSSCVLCWFDCWLLCVVMAIVLRFAVGVVLCLDSAVVHEAVLCYSAFSHALSVWSYVVGVVGAVATGVGCTDCRCACGVSVLVPAAVLAGWSRDNDCRCACGLKLW